MPELPDLAVISKNLNKRFANKKVIAFNVFKDKKLNTSIGEYKRDIENQLLESIERNGKELLLTFSNKKQLGIHLMLKGEIHLMSEPNIKYKVFELVFDSLQQGSLFGDNDGFSITDTMAQAKPILNPPKSIIPDALDDAFNYNYLKSILANSKKSNIKKILKNQDIVRGIGNAYIDEILWMAKVSPLSDGFKIPDEFIAKIVESTKETLKNAINEILTISPDLISGEIRSFLKIHNPDKNESPTGFPIKTIEIDTKKTYYTEEQILFE